jgi:N-acetylglucosaminyldiphosphoundecaprenol N-acetyl-beta-D-mannosaminyltransferase
MTTKVTVGGVQVDRLSAAGWVDLLLNDWRRKKEGGATKVVTTANGQVISLYDTDAVYRKAVDAADHVAADGMSVVFGSRFLTSTALPERVSTTDWFHDAAQAAAQHGMKFYMLGAAAEANARAVERARALYPGLQIVGARNGYFRDDEVEHIAAEIAASQADVLWVAVGNPRQVVLAHRFKTLVPSLTWVRTCGGLFDFLSGDAKRAPKLMQQLGLEWAFRSAQEPRRLLWRYLTTNVHSTYRILTQTRAT